MKKNKRGWWIEEHFSDRYVKCSKVYGFRSRSFFKLKEINDSYNIIEPGMIVVDLGASPGGWAQYVVSVLRGNGKVFAVDVLFMKPIKGVNFIQGDFTSAVIINQLVSNLGGARVDLLLSDMSPNFTGVKIIDQARCIELAQCACVFAQKMLNRRGVFLLKLFYLNLVQK